MNGIPEGKVGSPIYFGCDDTPLHGMGHMAFVTGPGFTMMSLIQNPGTWAKWLAHRDGTLVPEPDVEGSATIHHIAGRVTIIAWWDRSVDKRSGSNSMLMCDGIHNEKRMIEILHRLFVNIVDRQNATIVFKGG